MEEEILHFLTDDEEQAICVSWECKWNRFKRQFSRNRDEFSRYFRSRRLLAGYRGDCSSIFLEKALNLSVFLTEDCQSAS